MAWGNKKIGGKVYTPTVARYSKKEAEKLVSELRKYPKLSVETKKPTFKVQREVYKGKKTDRWLIYQDANSHRWRSMLNK